MNQIKWLAKQVRQLGYDEQKLFQIYFSYSIVSSDTAVIFKDYILNEKFYKVF